MKATTEQSEAVKARGRTASRFADVLEGEGRLNLLDGKPLLERRRGHPGLDRPPARL